MIYNQKLDLAIKFATKVHKNQLRKTDKDLPYIYHPISVGFILKNAGFADDIVMAGILHDVIEDCDVTFKELVEIFGKEVATIVSTVSEDKNQSWEKRKADYENIVLNSSVEVMAVSCADKLHNMYNVLNLLEQGHDLKDFFEKDTNTTINKYIKFVEAINLKWNHPLVEELEIVSEKLKQYIK